MSEVLDQVYETVLHKQVQHMLDPQFTCFVEVQVHITKDNGVPKELQGQWRGWNVRSDERCMSDSGDYLTA